MNRCEQCGDDPHGGDVHQLTHHAVPPRSLAEAYNELDIVARSFSAELAAEVLATRPVARTLQAEGQSYPAAFIREVARLAHEINRAYSAAHGDHSHAPWEQAPDYQRASCIAGVEAHVNAQFTLTPEQSHETWLAYKVAEGWVYGEVKDEVAKTHPCCRPYAELPEIQRVKDALFRAVVHAMLKPR